MPRSIWEEFPDIFPYSPRSPLDQHDQYGQNRSGQYHPANIIGGYPGVKSDKPFIVRFERLRKTPIGGAGRNSQFFTVLGDGVAPVKDLILIGPLLIILAAKGTQPEDKERGYTEENEPAI